MFFLACLFVACSGTKQPAAEAEGAVDVATAMEAQTDLKLSELGSNVRYIALETTDSCLIGKEPSILLMDEHIAVYTHKNCYLFDKASGKFLREIGHGGDDPEACATLSPTYSKQEKLLYFNGANYLQKYDLEGKYAGKLDFPAYAADRAFDSYLFTDAGFVGHYSNLIYGVGKHSLALFDRNGTMADSIPTVLPQDPERKKNVNDIERISVIKTGGAMAILTQFKDGTGTAGISGGRLLWENKGKVRFKEVYNDTIYTLEQGKLVASTYFDMGKWHWGSELRIETDESEKKLLTTQVLETESTLFFQCVRGIYTGGAEGFYGIYDKQKGTTRMCAEEKGIADDLTNFLPFRPTTCTTNGEYGMIVEAGKVLEWMEENPEEAASEKLDALKGVTEDSNPVVVIVAR